MYSILVLLCCFLFAFSETNNDNNVNNRELVGRLVSELEVLKAKVANLEHDCRKDKNNSKRLLMTGQPNAATTNHVAFYTQLANDLHGLATNRIVVFDKIHTNNGNSYSSLDGEFVCTVAGTYFLTWTISCSDNTAIETELVVNGQVKGHIFTDAGNHADYETNAGSVVLDLVVGDRVWIRVGRSYNGQIRGSGVGSSSFSGFLIRAA